MVIKRKMIGVFISLIMTILLSLSVFIYMLNGGDIDFGRDGGPYSGWAAIVLYQDTFIDGVWYRKYLAGKTFKTGGESKK